MDYKRNEIGKYNHHYYDDVNTFLIGVPKIFSKEEAKGLFLNRPMSTFKPSEKILAEERKIFKDERDIAKSIKELLKEKNFDINEKNSLYEQLNNLSEDHQAKLYYKIFQLDFNQRKAVLDTLDKWVIKSDTFIGLYWDIFLDFILALYGMTSMDITREMLKINIFRYSYKDEPYEDAEKSIHNKIDKLRNTKSKIGKNNQDLITMICFYFKFTKNIFECGYGTYYYYEGGKDYSLGQIIEYFNTHNEVDLKEMIIELACIQASDLMEIQVQIAIKQNRIDGTIYDFLDTLLDEMIKNRD